MTATIESPAPFSRIPVGSVLRAMGHADPDSAVYFAVTFVKFEVESKVVRADGKGLWIASTTNGLQAGNYVAHAIQLPANQGPFKPDALPPGAFVDVAVVAADHD